MHARHRAAILLGLLALALFVVRWPLDNYTCNPNTWKWRPSPADGANFFQTVFRGGGGTPAIFAMLGGQRYMVANITWNYTDVLFHKGKIYDMIYPYDATVTLNPAHTEAWSTYGWHLAWNLYSDAKDVMEKKKWLEAGKMVYIRAITTNKDKPMHRTDLARIYQEREGNHRKALNVLEPVIFPNTEAGDHPFQPLTAERKKNVTDIDVITERLWDTFLVGHRLAIIYRQIGVATGDWAYFKKALAVYEKCLEANPEDKNTARLIDDLKRRIETNDTAWLRERQASDAQIRKNFMLPPLKYGASMEKNWPDETRPDGAVVRGGETGIPGDKLRY